VTALIDTNVLLDVLARREPFYTAASRVWTLAERGSARALVSAISFNNVYYIVRKTSGKDQAALALRLMRDIFEVVAVDARIVDLAMEDPSVDDFEDAIQLHSAIQSHAPHLVTRNTSDFPTDRISVLSPDEFLALPHTDSHDSTK
jgi:predicted nucleic acid-binding protein